MPYETPNGCVYDSGDYATMLDIALELIGYDELEAQARRRGVAREAARPRDRLDARLRHEQLRPVAPDQPGAAVLRQQRGRDGEARHLRRDRGHARHDAAGPEPRDDGRPGRRRHPRLLARRRERPRGSRLLLELARRLLRHLREPVRRHRARRGEGRDRDARRGDEEARRGRARLRRPTTSSSPRARRACKDNPEAALPFMALGAIINANNAGLPGGPRRHAQLPLRLPAAVRAAGRRAQVRQPDADVRDAGARVRRRGRSRDGRLRDRRLRGRGRLRQADQPADRRGPGAWARPRRRSAPRRTRPSPTTRTGTC